MNLGFLKKKAIIKIENEQNFRVIMKYLLSLKPDEVDEVIINSCDFSNLSEEQYQQFDGNKDKRIFVKTLTITNCTFGSVDQVILLLTRRFPLCEKLVIKEDIYKNEEEVNIIGLKLNKKIKIDLSNAEPIIKHFVFLTCRQYGKDHGVVQTINEYPFYKYGVAMCTRQYIPKIPEKSSSLFGQMNDNNNNYQWGKIGDDNWKKLDEIKDKYLSDIYETLQKIRLLEQKEPSYSNSNKEEEKKNDNNEEEKKEEKLYLKFKNMFQHDSSEDDSTPKEELFERVTKLLIHRCVILAACEINYNLKGQFPTDDQIYNALSHYYRPELFTSFQIESPTQEKFDACTQWPLFYEWKNNKLKYNSLNLIISIDLWDLYVGSYNRWMETVNKIEEINENNKIDLNTKEARLIELNKKEKIRKKKNIIIYKLNYYMQ